MTKTAPAPAPTARPSSDSLKARVLAVKPLLAGHSYIDVALAALPEFDTAKGGQQLSNIWLLKSSNEAVTEAWENFARQLGAGRQAA